MKNLFMFDIETCGEHKTFDDFKAFDERGAKLFEAKYKRMGWDQKFSIDESYIEQSGIMSTYGRICCISFGYLDNNDQKQIRSLYGEDEKDIVEGFNSLLMKIEKKDFKLSGFRINYFDITWILHKLHKYGIEPAKIISPYEKKPWDMRIIDISDDWKGKFAYSYSLDEVAYELGIESPKENICGSDIHSYYHSGRLEEIRNYCEKDIETCIEIAKKIYGKY